jgi:hypothetical protein
LTRRRNRDRRLEIRGGAPGAPGHRRVDQRA